MVSSHKVEKQNHLRKRVIGVKKRGLREKPQEYEEKLNRLFPDSSKLMGKVFRKSGV